MPLDPDHLRTLRGRGHRVNYDERTSMAYALALGLGRQLDGFPFVAAGPQGDLQLRTVPTLAQLLATPDFLQDCGWNAGALQLAREQLRWHRPLDEAGSLLVDGDVVGLHDLGVDAGALIDIELRVRRERDGQALFTTRRQLLARGDGGFGGTRPPAVAEEHAPRKPDLVASNTLNLEQLLLLRASVTGQVTRELLPLDLTALRNGGSGAVAVPGAMLLGTICHDLLRVICEYDHTLIASLDASFAVSAYLGERLVTEFWQEANVVSFQVRVTQREEIVCRGRCLLAA